MLNINEYAKTLSPSLFLQLKEAVEIGKWKNGESLTDAQKEHTLQLVITYQSLYNHSPEHFSIAKGGELYMEKKSILRKQFSPAQTIDVQEK
ncbi:hypothetical protein PCNPT3_05295 [Psychromonas sp. CNPT3]|uniref:YeaC family protein n=1 Tax=Psychromonas sp. CNPT3 TaxID=314282 RepID=UPI00006E48C6|nr:DUF1315 family protein [Psychromonas sp. CNPT3]AGH81001.1 hypothetical protein PCNPT3_05295 [Psychromonas sp. CNPT3]